MFKVYKWLGYYLLRPYKRFEHLLKYLAIYFAKLNKLQKNRKERLNRIRKRTYLSPRGEAHLSSRPSPRSLFCRLPPRAPKQLAGAAEHAVDATSTPSSFQAAPGRQRAPRRRPRLPLSLSPIAASSRALLWFPPSSPRASAAHRR